MIVARNHFAPAYLLSFLTLQREELIPHLPHRFHVELLAGEEDLATRLVFPLLEIARHVHPPDGLSASCLVRLADDEVHVDRLIDPVFEMAFVLHIEYFVFHSSNHTRRPSCFSRSASRRTRGLSFAL